MENYYLGKLLLLLGYQGIRVLNTVLFRGVGLRRNANSICTMGRVIFLHVFAAVLCLEMESRQYSVTGFQS
jgi:hypothetical protein